MVETHFMRSGFGFESHSVPVDCHHIDRLGDAFERDRTRSRDGKSRGRTLHSVHTGKDLPATGKAADASGLMDSSSGKVSSAGGSLRLV